MKTLIKSALVIDSKSEHHLQTRDILIANGKIEKMGVRISDTDAKVIKEVGLCVSPGWIDLRANFRDPGAEFKEDLQSGIRAARRGGFTKVVLMPSTLPVADGKSAISYTLSKSKNSKVQILPTGTLSEKMEGKQLSEMFDMHSAGAVAFTDDKSAVSTELMVRALDYSRNFGGLLFSFPLDLGVNPGGMIHEGATSVAMGIKGLSSLSEELRLQRDIELLRYCGGRLHVSLISTARSADMIRKAKKEGLKITCAIAAHQLSFLDEDLIDFDSNLKVIPPFRSRADKKALVVALKDGTIDAICSDHSPEDTEHKVLEFEYANDGISSIETAFCSAYTSTETELSIEQLILKFTHGAANVLGIQLEPIAKGSSAEITLFSSELNTSFLEKNWISKSKYSPFLGKELRGRVIEW